MPLALALVETLSITAAPVNLIQEDTSCTAERHGVARLLSFISHLELFLLIGVQAKLRLPVHLAVPAGVDRSCERPWLTTTRAETPDLRSRDHLSHST
ncbi:hypothetical protein D3C71_1280960 [compost metagenome]